MNVEGFKPTQEEYEALFDKYLVSALESNKINENMIALMKLKNAPQNKKLTLPAGNNDVIIETSGQDKIALLTAIRNILACDLITGKNIVDNLPYTILTDISEEAANDIKALLEKTGSVITIKTK